VAIRAVATSLIAVESDGTAAIVPVVSREGLRALTGSGWRLLDGLRLIVFCI
jgi:hypothetical protein